MYNLDTFPNRILLALAALLPIFSIPHFSSHFLNIFVTLPVLCPFFPLCFTAVQLPGILFFLLQDLCSFSPCCRLRDLVQESRTSFRTLYHLRHCWLMHFLHFSFSSLNFISSTFYPFLQSIFPSCVDPRFLTVCRQQLRDLNFLIRSFIITILCCCFISSSSADSSCLICRRCKLYSPKKEKIIAQQSSRHFRILYVLLLRTLLHSRGAPLPLKASFLPSSTSYFFRTSSSILSAKFFQQSSL